jgi:hypothetical protein
MIVKVTFTPGLFAAGFGKGKFKSGLTPNSATLEIPFVLKSGDDHVLVAGNYVTVKKAVEEQKATQPDAKVCYHAIVENPDDSFSLTKVCNSQT